MTGDGCVICNADLVYLEKSELMTCNVCKKKFDSNAHCVNSHFVCDECHEKEGLDYIETICSNSSEKDPIALANAIMNNPNIKLHGPEHHFLVPSVLLTAYYNTIGHPEMIPEKIKTAKQRAKNILGGFCGLYGNCGAGVGTGIFMSIILNSTPLSKEEWKLSNLITSESLYDIAMHGGPRCCKRDTYLSLETAIRFVEKNLKVRLESSVMHCTFYPRNKECKLRDCGYFPKNARI